jgi:hypothetical protein
MERICYDLCEYGPWGSVPATHLYGEFSALVLDINFDSYRCILALLAYSIGAETFMNICFSLPTFICETVLWGYWFALLSRYV